MTTDDEARLSTPGRNDPCPCGSGKKYKHCCLRRPGGIPRVLDDVPPPGALHAAWDDVGKVGEVGEVGDVGEEGEAAAFSELLRTAMEEREFGSLAEAQDFIESFTATYDHDPLPGFDGLSPEQMQALLYAPTRSPEVLRVARSLDTTPRAPLLAWFHLIADALGEDGVRATQKGNLPRALCRDAAMRAHDDPDFGPHSYLPKPHEVRGEDDLFPLHRARVIARDAGLVRLYRQRWTLTRRAREALAAGDEAELYLRLFESATFRIDWRYGTRYAGMDMLQPTWPFLLRLLQRYGDEPRPADFYVGALLEAFPAFEDEAIAGIDPWMIELGDPVETAVRRLRRAIRSLALERFARQLGLVELERHVPDPETPWDRNWIVRATPLAHEVVRFEV